MIKQTDLFSDLPNTIMVIGTETRIKNAITAAKSKKTMLNIDFED